MSANLTISLHHMYLDFSRQSYMTCNSMHLFFPLYEWMAEFPMVYLLMFLQSFTTFLAWCVLLFFFQAALVNVVYYAAYLLEREMWCIICKYNTTILREIIKTLFFFPSLVYMTKRCLFNNNQPCNSYLFFYHILTLTCSHTNTTLLLSIFYTDDTEDQYLGCIYYFIGSNFIEE